MAPTPHLHPTADAGGAPPDLTDGAVRRRLSAPGFGAFVKLCGRLQLGQDAQRRLLGEVPRRTYQRWTATAPDDLGLDQLERISLFLGIYKALQILFPIAERRDAWLRAANADQPFGGLSPLDYLLRGSLQGLWETRRYLDAWRGGWP